MTCYRFFFLFSPKPLMIFPMVMVCTTLSLPTVSQMSPIPTRPMKLPTPILENSQLAVPGSMPLDIAWSCNA